MDLIKIQKEIAKEVLEELEVIDPYCILAGGAPRDWFFNKPAKDLDFYVYDDRGLTQGVWIERLNKTLLDVRPLGHVDKERAEEEYTSMKDLSYVFEGECMGMTVQVMIMSSPTFQSVVPNFCVDTSKIWWKGSFIEPTWEFLLAVSSKTLFFDEEHMPKQRYIDKMEEYFPDYVVTSDKYVYENRLLQFKTLLGLRNNREIINLFLDHQTWAEGEVSIPFIVR